MDSNLGRAGGLILVALVPLFFSTNLVIGRSLAGEVAPWTLAFLRWTAAFVLTLPFALAGLRRSAKELKAQAPLIVTLGFLGMFVCGGAVYIGLQYTTATNAILIYSATPVMVLILEWMFRGRAFRWIESLGTALAFSGVAVVALGAAGFRLSLNPGDALIAVAALSWAIYSVLQKRPGLTAVPNLALFAAIMAAGAVLLAPAMLIEQADGGALPRSGETWLAVAALAVFPSVGAFFGYQYGVRLLGPATMSMSLYMQPLYGVALALLLLGERLHAYHLVGFALILPGVVLATFRRRAEGTGPAAGGAAALR